MNHRAFLILFILVSAATSLYAEKAIIDVYQPTSLLGTELDGDPLGTGESLAAVILSRPVIVSGAFPESPVAAISLPHRIAGAPEGFPEESNLIVLVGAEIYAEWGETGDRIVADFSRAKSPEDLGVTLLQIMQLSAVCLQKTLGDRHGKPIRITWLPPEGVSLEGAKLPAEIMRSPGREPKAEEAEDIRK